MLDKCICNLNIGKSEIISPDYGDWNFM